MAQIIANLTDEDKNKINRHYEEMQGFTKVILELKKAKKPIIGHNMMFDVLFTYEKFIAPLPRTFKEFAKEWKNTFGTVYDTKVLGRHIMSL